MRMLKEITKDTREKRKHLSFIRNTEECQRGRRIKQKFEYQH